MSSRENKYHGPARARAAGYYRGGYLGSGKLQKPHKPHARYHSSRTGISYGEAISILPGDGTIPQQVHDLAAKDLHELTLETDKAKGSPIQVTPSKKRPATSEIKVTGPPERSGSPAKLHRTSYGDLSFSRASPEQHLNLASNHARARNATSPFRRSATENVEREAKRAREAELLEHPLSPGANYNAGEDSTAIQREFVSSSRSRAKAGAFSRLPPGPQRTAQDVMEQSHAIECDSCVVSPKQYADPRQERRRLADRFSGHDKVDAVIIAQEHEQGEGKDDEDDEYEEEPNTDLIRQPASRPISQQQLATEVKAIYSGLSMIEQKCVNIINSPGTYAGEPERGPSSSTPRSLVDQWKALIALHRTLLHEHHDFFLASQHPAASPAIRELASKYSMPARMWKHGIHSFLELLRHRLPGSLDYMLEFIYLSYQMMALLYETVPSFEETWIECLGDLARYRMAIEDEDVRDRDTWTSVARMWYSKAVDRNPSVGRLYHHLAILSRRYAVQQLSSYARSLTAISPFLSTKESIMTLFDPILARVENFDPKVSPNALPHDTWFVVIHALLFTGGEQKKLENACQCFVVGLDNSMSAGGYGWGQHSSYFAVTIIASILKFGSTKSKIRAIMTPSVGPGNKPGYTTDERRSQQQERGQEKQVGVSSAAGAFSNMSSSMSTKRLDPDDTLSNEWQLLFRSMTKILSPPKGVNVLSFLHVILVFLWKLASSTREGSREGQLYLGISAFPWSPIAEYLNSVLSARSKGAKKSPLPDIEAIALHDPRNQNKELSSPFVLLEQGDKRPLPEDFLMRGQVWAEGYFPTTWFDEAIGQLNEDERWTDFASSTPLREDRVLGLAILLASLGSSASALKSRVSADTHQLDTNNGSEPQTKSKWLHYDSSTEHFTVAAKFADARHARVSQSAYNAANSGEADRGGPKRSDGDVDSTVDSGSEHPVGLLGGDVIMGER